MSDRTMNFLRAGVCAFIAICCLGLKGLGIAAPDSKFPYAAAGLCAFLTIAYLKRAFDD